MTIQELNTLVYAAETAQEAQAILAAYKANPETFTGIETPSQTAEDSRQSNPTYYGSVVSQDGQYADSSDYYNSPAWLAMQSANNALQTATEAVREIQNEIELVGETPELNDALNAAGKGQEYALAGYQATENARTVQEASRAAQMAVAGAVEAEQAAANVGILVTAVQVEEAQPEQESPLTLGMILAGLWYAFR